ncbi:hypothetical protein F2P81_019294 [Scophthalmus maximus]|uniref:Uncharacterized protein n=1 Tax=Scophthalmus maximus TaxID=52904 RepID=A0A6A4S566_SCOMX|nr:hypothetical protein F2P81_019294 [Scophthalmus maximus]
MRCNGLSSSVILLAFEFDKCARQQNHTQERRRTDRDGDVMRAVRDGTTLSNNVYRTPQHRGHFRTQARCRVTTLTIQRNSSRRTDAVFHDWKRLHNS